jgi:hypothetical protein
MATVPSTPPASKPRRPRPKPANPVNLLIAPTATMPGIVRIQLDGQTWTDYNLAPIHADYGRAFRLVKLLGPHDRYDVLLNGEHSTCECLGFLHHGHCKHVGGLYALCEKGVL